MKINSKTIKDWANKIASDFSEATNAYSENDILINEIDCSKLDEIFIHQDIRYSEDFRDLFNQLEKIEEKPCVYFFEILSDISPKIIVESIEKSNGNGTKPAIKKIYSQESKILYVGKVKKTIWGRLIMHMGFHTNKNKPGSQSTAHGLQLQHWAKELNLKLKFHVYAFDPQLADYMEIFEREFAKKLQPIIGRH